MLIHKSLESIKEHTLVKTVCMPNKTFTIEEELMRAQTDEKPFECLTCNMSFTRKEQLETHEKT